MYVGQGRLGVKTLLLDRTLILLRMVLSPLLKISSEKRVCWVVMGRDFRPKFMAIKPSEYNQPYASVTPYSFIKLMIIRGNRSASHLKGQENRVLALRLENLRKENRQLRLDLLRVEQKLVEAQQGKKKYKAMYKEAREKIQILGLASIHPNKFREPYDCCLSPLTHTQLTRIRSTNESDFASLRAGFTHSEILDNIPTKQYLPQTDDYQSFPKKAATPITSFKQSQANREESKLIENLMLVHEQLEKLSEQIEHKSEPNAKILQLEGELYRKVEEVVDKLNRMEVRDIQRENQRVSREKERNAKRYSSSLKAVQKIGKDLLSFKVQE